MGEPQISVRWASDPRDVSAALALRLSVFCDEQGVSREDELDGLDEQALHLIALAPDGDGAVGTLRLLLNGEHVKLGRVAVAREWRRRGIASQMIHAGLQEARRRGALSARLASQLDATALYERAGFAVESEPFQSAGIAHVWMGLTLAADGPAADRPAADGTRPAGATTDEISRARPS
jgi:predicted GNAT family N-acyltransferase